VSRRPGPRADYATGLVGAERGLRHGRSRGRAEWPDREARPAFKPAALAAPGRAEYPSTPLGLVQRTPNLLGALHAARTRSQADRAGRLAVARSQPALMGSAAVRFPARHLWAAYYDPADLRLTRSGSMVRRRTASVDERADRSFPKLRYGRIVASVPHGKFLSV
jgi:hypothetical protein